MTVDIPRMIDFRHAMHADPEVGLDLPHTQQRVLEAIDGLGLEISTGDRCTSVTAVLRGGAAPATGSRRPAVLLRADMDGLPVDERTGLDWASTNGAMHACGHDTHTAMLLGALWELAATQDDLPGDVIFMFQPGEEGRNGAGIMLDEGVLEAAGTRPDAAMGLHSWSNRPHGVVALRGGPMMASGDLYRLTVTGRDGHGSAPHRAKDPIPALLASVNAIQVGITRDFDIFHPVVFTVGSIHSGSRANIIPADGYFEATVRTFDAGTREKFADTIERVGRGIAEAYDVKVELERRIGYPVLVNDEQEARFAAELITEQFGDHAVELMRDPDPGSEDFSRVLERVPGFFAYLGACPPDIDPATAAANHSAYALFDDGALQRGAELEVAWTRQRLAAAPA